MPYHPTFNFSNCTIREGDCLFAPTPSGDHQTLACTYNLCLKADQASAAYQKCKALGIQLYTVINNDITKKNPTFMNYEKECAALINYFNLRSPSNIDSNNLADYCKKVSVVDSSLETDCKGRTQDFVNDCFVSLDKLDSTSCSNDVNYFMTACVNYAEKYQPNSIEDFLTTKANIICCEGETATGFPSCHDFN